MNTKYTPAPWDFVEGKTLLHIETRHDHPDGAGIPICSIPKRDKANAQLIAAAPDLLAALENILDAFAPEENILDAFAPEEKHSKATREAAVSEALAAIAKATGN